MSGSALPGCGVAPLRTASASLPPVSALGCVETRSIAAGVEAADAMAKSAEVRLELAAATCPGKYLIMVSGSVAAVRSAVEAGVRAAGATLTDHTVIPSVHPQVFPALTAMTDVKIEGAVGVIETFTMPAALTAADQAVKTASVDLVEIRLGRGLAGKAFVLLTGRVSAVREAVAAAVRSMADQAMLLGTSVIPSPHPDLLDKLI